MNQPQLDELMQEEPAAKDQSGLRLRETLRELSQVERAKMEGRARFAAFYKKIADID